MEVIIVNIKPLADNVVLKLVEAEETTKSGIVLASTVKEKPQLAEIIAVGPGGVINGNEVKMYVNVGEKVVFNKFSATEIKLDGQEFLIIRQGDILAVIE
jgi:chaperonin GroES